MRPLFAIAPLALLLALVGPRPSERDGGEPVRMVAAVPPVPHTASAPDHRHVHGGTDHGVQALRTSARGVMGATTDAGYPAALPR